MPNLNYIDSVDSEGGPLLLSDAINACAWQGTEGDGSDYERIDGLLPDGTPGVVIPLGTGQALLWDLGGPGTGDIYYKDGHFMLIRVWINDPRDVDAINALSDLPLNNPINLGELELVSGTIAALWAAESGVGITGQLGDIITNAQLGNNTESDFVGLLVRVPKGTYSCLHDEVIIGSESARRCHLNIKPAFE